jgi:hypothetical protein
MGCSFVWEEGFRALVSYKDRIGDCHVPIDHFENGFALGRWVNKQRKRRHLLLENELNRLERLGVDWTYSAKRWEDGFRYLKAYKDRVGDCEVQFNHREGNFSLGRWVCEQRSRKSQLSSEERERLDSLGFDWDVGLSKWERAFIFLEMYKKQRGDCRVPIRFIEDGFKLGRWVEKQRRSKDRLSEGQRRKLDQIGFEWDPRLRAGLPKR